MNAASCTTLQGFITLYPDNTGVQSIADKLNSGIDQNNTEQLIQLYHEAIPFIEGELWKNTPDKKQIEEYQRLFQELEVLIASQSEDTRHEFVIVIPVADRPQHLTQCLDSLLTLCKQYSYGGKINNQYNKISVIIADDSHDTHNIESNQNIAQRFNKAGLETIYLGQDEQRQLVKELLDNNDIALTSILGSSTEKGYSHKGPSIMRNICYLKLNRIRQQRDKVLFYFIDSDQEFQIKVNNGAAHSNLYAINYFYYLDRIFSNTETQILTGKVVGDPPVSPAVMAGNFLEDIIAFLHEAKDSGLNTACQFHQAAQQQADDAAYHDMSDLFGFKQQQSHYRYQCTLSGEHDNVDCISDFTNKLNQFFDGQHPTRTTAYEYENIMDGIKPARTIYTGNYIFRPEALDFFIPFASLKLRMAGPVLGRIIKSSLGDSFVSANLPMLHKRTVDSIGQSEFRPGINREHSLVDLSGEFERQYYGDVMLFSMQQLTKKDFPDTALSENTISDIVLDIEKSLHEKYLQKQQLILDRLARLKTIYSDLLKQWHDSAILDSSLSQLQQFIDNIEHNFSEHAAGYRLINDTSHRQQRLHDIIQAIGRYPSERTNWQQTLKC